MNLYEEIEKIKTAGYSELNAQSKLGQDMDVEQSSVAYMVNYDKDYGNIVLL